MRLMTRIHHLSIQQKHNNTLTMEKAQIEDVLHCFSLITDK